MAALAAPWVPVRASAPDAPGSGSPGTSAQGAPGAVKEVAQTKGEGWAVILFNDDVHSFDEVITAIIKATGFDVDAAVAITMRAHNNGKAVVLITDKAEAERVASVLRTAKLTVELRAV